jgi:hypothetical protein
MTTKRIDSQIELIDFIHLLQKNFIEIPQNVTLQIDSKYLEADIFNSLQEIYNLSIPEKLNDFTFMGQKVSLKQQEQ